MMGRTGKRREELKNKGVMRFMTDQNPYQVIRPGAATFISNEFSVWTENAIRSRNM